MTIELGFDSSVARPSGFESVDIGWGRHLLSSAALLQMLERTMGLGTFRLELPSGDIYCSDAACRMFGFEPTREPLPLSALFGAVVHGDKRRGALLLTQTIERKQGYREILRVKVNGETTTVECIAETECNRLGDVIAVIGTVRDISERVAINARASSHSLVMRALLHNVPAAIAILDRDMCYLAVSDYWAVGHGNRTPRELVGKSHYEVHPELTEDVRLDHLKVLDGATLHRPRAFLKDRNGNFIKQTCVMCPWYTVDNRVGGMMILLGTVDTQNALPKALANSPLPTREEFLKILSEL